jgi:gliding motility-associated-like protein
MRSILLFLCLIALAPAIYARHGAGGSITYEYLGAGTSTSSKYRITVKHFIDCASINLAEANVNLGIFDAGSNALTKTVAIPQTNTYYLQKTTFNPCINPAPTVCYYVVVYVTELELTDNTAGYLLAEQECCRISGIVNVVNSSGYGTTNTNTIPGMIGGIAYRKNSSPMFAEKDTAVICHNSYFSIDFGAVDEDGDQLTYAFCSSLVGASMQNRQPNPPSNPPYAEVPYASGYSAASPMGGSVTVDPATGLISGIAPAQTGSYVIAVCVTEIRNGVQINSTRKEVQIKVADCTLAGAQLESSYINCDNFTFTFQNLNTSTSINGFTWDFGVPNTTADVSTSAMPTYTYADTGTYEVKLKVASSNGCADSASAPVRVYPGFKPGFTVSGSCYQSPFIFTDTSYVKYGSISSYAWDFGDNAGTSSIKNPVYQYTSPQTVTVSLKIASTKGCTGTATKNVIINTKPDLTLGFKDTLICSIDTLQLKAAGNGTFAWAPAYNIRGAASPAPLVFPKDTTTYVVTLTDKGCIARDSVKVNVLDYITVSLPADTTICQTDSIQLRPVSAGLQYLWTPPTALSNETIKYPKAAPLTATTYKVTANLGKCPAMAFITVKVTPYPVANAGADTIICYNTAGLLHGTITGSSFNWAPVQTLTAANTLQPVARPFQTTAYVLTARDTLGCPKPGRDTVVVSVLPQIMAFAGSDTNVVAAQPLQLQASGGDGYQWSPGTYLSATNIPNPVAVFDGYAETVTYVVDVTKDGCHATDDIVIKIFKTGPDILVPNAFTPNSDGKNDVLRPILVGMKSLQFFRVYNRWGDLVFSTTEEGRGWNGYIKDHPQATANFIYVAQGIDYTGKTVFRKGSVMLIR